MNGIAHHRAAQAAVIGDIHGDARALRALLEKIGERRDVIVVGDLCDRGPDTRGVLDLLRARRARGVFGNHDQVFMHWLAGGELDRDWLRPHMGGAATLASYGIDPDAPERARVPAEHREFLESLALVLDLEVAGEPYWVIHAGIPTGRSMRGVAFDDLVPHVVREHPQDLLWGANDPESAVPVGRPVIMGHVCVRRPIVNDDVIAIDTGCATVKDGKLTAVLLPERTLISV